MKILHLLAINSFILLVGCASAPMAPSNLDQKAKSFDSVSDKAVLYIYRNETFGAAATMDININSKRVGQTAPKTYFKFDLTPGKYIIQSDSENTSILELEISAGKSYFVWQEVKMGVLYARSKLHLMSEAEGKAGVLESKLIDTSISAEQLSLKSDKQEMATLKSKLTELKTLKESGMITDKEHDELKTKILETY